MAPPLLNDESLMLQKIRDNLQGVVAFAVLGAIAIVFVSWGANSQMLSFGTGGNDAAEVNGEKISIEDARNAWSQQQAQFGGADLPEAFKKQMQDGVLEAMISNEVVNQHAVKEGYRVPPSQIHDAIRQVPAFQIQGKYSPEAAMSRLAQAGVTIQKFESEVKLELLRTQLQRSIATSDFVTPVELERLHALEDQQREVRYLTLPAEKFVGTAPVDDAAVQDYMKKNQARFMTQESVRLAYGELRLDQIAARVTVTDADIREAYDKAKAKYVQGEKRRARHILIAEGPNAAKTAEQVLAEARKPGADFAALAKKYSTDTGTAREGGELGWVERGNLVKPFEDALYAMKAGDIVGPVQTQFGEHIIQLEEIQAGRTRTFEEARGEIESQLKSDRASAQLGDAQEQIQHKIEDSNADFDALVKEFNLQPGEAPTFTRETGGAPLGDGQELRELVFSGPVLDEKRIGGPIGLGEDRLVIIKVLEHRKPAPRPLADVRDEIVAAIKKERGTQAAQKAADDARAKLMSGTSFENVAKGLGVTAEPAHFVGRRDPSTPAPIRSLAFEVPNPAGKPSYRTVALEDGGIAVVGITAERLDPAANTGDQLKERQQQAAIQRGRGDVMAYMAQLRRAADVTKNPKTFE